jgi:hypothetical protein
MIDTAPYVPLFVSWFPLVCDVTLFVLNAFEKGPNFLEPCACIRILMSVSFIVISAMEDNGGFLWCLQHTRELSNVGLFAVYWCLLNRFFPLTENYDFFFLGVPCYIMGFILVLGAYMLCVSERRVRSRDFMLTIVIYCCLVVQRRVILPRYLPHQYLFVCQVVSELVGAFILFQRANTTHPIVCFYAQLHSTHLNIPM